MSLSSGLISSKEVVILAHAIGITGMSRIEKENFEYVHFKGKDALVKPITVQLN